MRNKGFRDLVLFCVLGTLLLAAMLYWTVRKEGVMPEYSVLNKSRDGCSIYFETLEALGLDVDRVIEPIGEQPQASVQIVAYTWWFDAEQETVRQWVMDGGTLVLIGPFEEIEVDYGTDPTVQEGVILIEAGEGRILSVDGTLLKNGKIEKNKATAYALTAAMLQQGPASLVFNEGTLFPEALRQSLWDAAPLWARLLVYQVLLLGAAWFWHRGQRLGRPRALVEETERTELEYLNAAAHFYRRTGNWHLMVKAYHTALLRRLKASEADWTEVWRREGLPELERAESLDAWLKRPEGTADPKGAQHQIQTADHLRTLIEKRRHMGWNRSKP